MYDSMKEAKGWPGIAYDERVNALFFFGVEVAALNPRVQLRHSHHSLRLRCVCRQSATAAASKVGCKGGIASLAVTYNEGRCNISGTLDGERRYAALYL